VEEVAVVQAAPLAANIEECMGCRLAAAVSDGCPCGRHARDGERTNILRDFSRWSSKAAVIPCVLALAGLLTWVEGLGRRSLVVPGDEVHTRAHLRREDSSHGRR
jgi:hypothetical protein